MSCLFLFGEINNMTANIVVYVTTGQLFTLSTNTYVYRDIHKTWTNV